MNRHSQDWEIAVPDSVGCDFAVVGFVVTDCLGRHCTGFRWQQPLVGSPTLFEMPQFELVGREWDC